MIIFYKNENKKVLEITNQNKNILKKLCKLCKKNNIKYVII